MAKTLLHRRKYPANMPVWAELASVGELWGRLNPHFLGLLHKFSICKSTMGCPQKTHVGPM